MASVFGSYAKAQKILSHVASVGRQEGLILNFDQVTKSINTLPLHRILWKVAATNMQTDVALSFFDALFTKGIDLANHDNIAEVMKSFGWTKQQTHSFLSGSEGIEYVSAQRKKLLALNIQGVPFYIVNNTNEISGAQPAEVFEMTLRELATHPTTKQLHLN